MKLVETKLQHGERRAAPRLTRLRVLLVEDDPNDAALMARALRDAEGVAITLTHVATLAEACAVLSVGKVHLTLTDLTLPDAREAESVSRLVSLAHGPVIALTGSDDPSLRASAIAAGAYDFFRKSELTGATLTRVIRLAGVQSRATDAWLHESELRFRAVIDSVNEGILVYDRDYRVVSGNAMAERIIGVPLSEMIGKPGFTSLFECVNEDGSPLLPEDRPTRVTVRTGRTLNDRVIGLRRPNGTTTWLAINTGFLRDAGSSEHYGLVSTISDITAAKREEQLLRLEHHVARILAEADNPASALRAVLRAMCEAQGWDCGHFWRVDEAASLLRFGEVWTVMVPAIQRFTLRSRTVVFAPNVGLVGIVWKSGAPLWVPDTRADPRVMRSDITRETGLRSAFVFPVMVQGHTLGVISFSSREVREPDERLLEAVHVIGGQIGQFLQRKQAEAQLREREERFRSLTELSSDWYWEQDEHFRYVWVSKELEGGTDASQRDYVGKAPWELASMVPLVGTWDDHRRALAAHAPFRDFECAYLDQDGRPHDYVTISGLPMFDAAGNFCGYRGVGKGIGERKRTEERLVVHLVHQQLIAELGRRALSRKDLGALLDEAVALLAQGLRVAHAALYELASDDKTLNLRAATAEIGKASEAPLSAHEVTPIGVALVAGGPTVTADIERDPRLAVPNAPWARGLRSWVSVAIRGGARPWGVLVAASPHAEAFGTDAVAFIEAAASVLSSALLRHDSESRLAYLAQFDAVTGLPNRTLVRDRLDHTIAQARRKRWLVGVLFVDLDRFKLVNDTLGHQCGDRLLAEVGKRLATCVRDGDTVGRVSGDEFVVVLADLSRADDAGVVAQKIIAALSRPFVLDGHEAFVSASVGVALFPNDADDADTLLRDADAAMYRAKESGRSAYCFFTAEMNARSRERMQLQGELRHALERNEFRLMYQPKIDLATGRMCGLEALLRWTHPERGLVSPAEFIPVLEETGLIVTVGEWVIETVCAQLLAWRAAGCAPVPVAVNVSARQFQLKDFDARIVARLRSAGVAPELLEIEITESYLAPDPQHAIALLDNLQQAGVRVAIDDFGTGYSSLAYLTRFPVSSVKIDRQFVRDATSDPSDAAIVRAVIDMAHNLGFVVVAEGVETARQAQFLRAHGCDQAQGFYFARPAPVGAIASRLKAPRKARAARTPRAAKRVRKKK